MNVRLLKKIKKHILEEPKRLYMFIWLINDPYELKGSDLKEPSCGTVGCIAGWACALELDKKQLDSILAKEKLAGNLQIMRKARNLLELGEEEAERLFLPGEWPDKLALRLDDINWQTKAYAKLVADRIDLFIETKGAE